MRARRPLRVLLLALAAAVHAAPAIAEPSVAVEDPMLEPPPGPARRLAGWGEALEIARQRSTDLRTAVDEVDRAAGQSRVALGALLPTVNGTVNASHQFLTNTSSQVSGVNADGTPRFRTFEAPNPDVVTGGLAASMPLFNLRAWYARGTAVRNEEAASLALADRRRVLAAAIASATAAVWAAERTVELNRNGLRSALERLALTEARERAGAANDLDLARARQDVESARTLVVSGDEALRRAREALGLALGIPAQVGLTSEFDMARLEDGTLATCRSVAGIDERADVLAAKKRAEVAERGVGDVKLQFAPTIGVSSNVNTTSADVGASPRVTWNVQAQLVVPLWDGGARYGNLRTAAAVEDQALQQVEGLRRTGEIAIRQARRGVAVATASRDVAVRARDLAAQVDKLTRFAFERGQGTSVDLVLAAAALRQSELQLVVQELALAQARLAAHLTSSDCQF